MSKKHPERAQRRRQAQAERRRVETKRRKSAERARMVGVPRKEHASESQESGAAASLVDTAAGQRYVPTATEPPTDPPPERVVQAFRGALDEVLDGGGEVALEEAVWEPAASDRADADSYVRIGLRLFGQTAEVHGNIYPLNREEFADRDEVDLRVAERVLAALRQDRKVAGAAVLLYALDELLVDYLLLDEPQVAAVLRRLGVPRDLEDILEPLARGLSEEERRAWYAARDEGRWDERIGDVVFHSLVWESTGPLVDFGEWIWSASGEGWTPPWSMTAA